MNLLSNETSPYLLQHAHNPVHWFPWCEEAFEKAKAENKPVLVSIGYATCHWCHVMEKESFENEQVAQLMNQLFVCIKVDREELPDVDHFYMDAVQAMTGSGGWPLNVFCNANKKPFYGGTYFPPTQMHNRASWTSTLINVSGYYQNNQNEVEQQTQKLFSHLQTLSTTTNHTQTSELNQENDIETIVNKCLQQADTQEGGFGMAPKFPSTFTLNFLLDNYILYKNESSLEHVILSLDKMRMGGIYDCLKGGFARYSTDKYWIAPHFEKMLYDNALLIELYAKAFNLTKNNEYKLVVEQTIQWLQDEMMNDEGGFYSAQDADSEGIEGKYYTWHYNQLKEIVGERFNDFCAYYSIAENGNWEHTNILYSTYETEKNASEEFKKALPIIHQQLLNERNKRIKPITDDKIIIGWNALMNKALVTASIYLNNEMYLQLAEKNMQFILQKMASEKYLFFRTYKNGVAKINAYADDLAYLSLALIELSKVTANTNYIQQAISIVNYLDQHFKDENNFYSFSNKQFNQFEINKQELYDGALPSINAICCQLKYELSFWTMDTSWEQQSTTMLNQQYPQVLKFPTSFSNWAIQLQHTQSELLEIKIIGKNASSFYQQLKKIKPNAIFIISNEKTNAIPSISSYDTTLDTVFFICKNQQCLPPIYSFEKLMGEIN